jgi:hypothetical protein
MADIHIRTLHDPEGKHPDLPDYWLAWANGVQGDGTTKDGAIANAKARLAAGEAVDRAGQVRGQPAPIYAGGQLVHQSTD